MIGATLLVKLLGYSLLPYIFLTLLSNVLGEDYLASRWNIKFSPLHLELRTHAANDLLLSLLPSHTDTTRRLSRWFTIGMYMGCLGLLLSLPALMYSLYLTLQALIGDPASADIFPALPGNYPHMLTFSMAILVSVLIHEVGHALSAAVEHVRLKSVGVALSGVFPGAFVELSEDLNELTPTQKLKVFCAGVWHNVALCLLLLCIASSLSLVYFPFYKHSHSGAVVNYISPSSPLTQYLSPGDVIVKLNDLAVFSSEGWRSALQISSIALLKDEMKVMPQSKSLRKERLDKKEEVKGPSRRGMGYCIEEEALESLDTSCCQEDGDKSKQCFAYTFKSEVDISEKDMKLVCLGINDMNSLTTMCKDDCEKAICVRPFIEIPDTVIRLTLSDNRQIFFIGHPDNLDAALDVGNYQLRNYVADVLLSRTNLYQFILSIPASLDVLLTATIRLSASIAVFNVCPVSYTDGEHMVRILAFIVSPKHHMMVSNMIVKAGNVLLGFNVVAYALLYAARY